jgi:predicted DNA-binding transcriptional regulator AlpA
MARSDALPASLAPVGLGREVAAQFLGISAAKFDELVKDGRMPKPKRIDARKIWDRREVELAFSALPADAGPNEWDDATF